ncbi:hypothetical protein PVK06_016738 [Gossypium arboreum]|uniref:Uncharacterized protein n=1 Tax=Gossypium arboreum TaxID=29729 RepID=A0ABR0Q0T8_GOSAR|nr:hypothetical protein PVK06_016738 [Gossypium arboreum]
MSDPTTEPNIGDGQSNSVRTSVNNGTGAGRFSGRPGKEMDTNFLSGEQAGSNKNMVLDDVNCENSSNEIRGVLNNGNFNNIVAHVNQAFEDSGGTIVTISKDVLDPEKHSAITFKDSTHKKEKGRLANSSRGNFGEGVSRSREKSRGKELFGRNGQKASSALHGRGSRFKAFGNSRVPLAKSME